MVVLTLSLAAPVGASAITTRIRIDGEFVAIPSGDQPPVIIEGRTLVPLRVVMEALGFDVYWDGETRVVTLHGTNVILMLPMQEIQQEKGFPVCPETFMHSPGNLYVANTLGNDDAVVTGRIIPLDVPPRIINNRTMVPVRAISEATGMIVEWDGVNRVVDIKTGSTRSPMQSEPPQLEPEPESVPATLPNRRLTDTERAEWIGEYWAMGGPTTFELEIVRLINEVRADNNLSILEMDDTLMMSARFYTQIMSDLNTGLGHNMGPYRVEGATHGASRAVVEAFGGQLRWNGGNGAAGHGSPEAVVNSWINSEGHRRYIMSPEHSYIGAGRFGTFTYLFLSDSRS